MALQFISMKVSVTSCKHIMLYFMNIGIRLLSCHPPSKRALEVLWQIRTASYSNTDAARRQPYVRGKERSGRVQPNMSARATLRKTDSEPQLKSSWAISQTRSLTFSNRPADFGNAASVPFWHISSTFHWDARLGGNSPIGLHYSKNEFYWLAAPGDDISALADSLFGTRFSQNTLLLQ